MRLTLRTLLAYRDGMLSPTDAEDLQTRIYQSQDASNLLKRINAITSNVQRSSKTIVGRGMGGDPNSIAEYLDDVLPNTSVPELEKVCLQSDEYLAELAACHSLLSSAMHTHVKVSGPLKAMASSLSDAGQRKQVKKKLHWKKGAGSDAESGRDGKWPSVAAELIKEPITDSSEQADEERVEPVEAVAVQAPMVSTGGESIRHEGLSLEGDALSHEVPEYLLGTAGGRWRMPAAICAMLVLLALLLWQTLGPFDQIQAMFSAGDSAGDNQPTVGSADSNAPVSSNAANAAGDAASSGAVDANSTSDASAAVASGDVPRDDSVSSATGDVPAEAGDNGDPTEAISPGQDETQLPGNDQAAVDGPESATGTENASPAQAVLLASANQDRTQTLAFTRSASGELNAVTADAPLGPQDRILVMPQDDIRLALGSGVSARVIGPAILKAQQSQLELDFARVLLSVTDPQEPLTLVTPDGNFRLQFEQADSSVAIERGFRFEKRGSVLDPSLFVPVLVVVPDSPMRVALPDGKELAIAAGEGMASVAQAEPKLFAMRNIPRWYSFRAFRAIDREALVEIKGDWKHGEDVQLQLAGLAQHQRPEQAALAIQTQMMQGNWDAFASEEFLENPEMAVHRRHTFDLARQLIASDRQQAASLETVMKAGLPEGERAFQLLVGWPHEQLHEAGIVELINLLNARTLATRGLAFYELQNLTGRKLGYVPEAPDRASTLAWRRELSTNRLPILPVADVIWERIRQ